MFGSPTSSPRPPAPRQLIPLLAIIVAACLTVATTYSHFGHTWDEPEHLAAGMALIDKGEYPYDLQHPPLARIAMALGPYLAGARAYGNSGPSGEEEGRDILYTPGKYDLYLTLARIGMLPFLIALLVATWLWSRHFYGPNEAILATALVATTPVILGHAGVAALDIPMVGTTLPALYLLLRWLEVPTQRNALMFGVAAGMAAATKLSAIPFIGVTALIWVAAMAVARTSPIPMLKQAPVAALAAAFVLSACYAFDVDLLRASFAALLEHNRGGHLSYFMGELRRSGWWNFYLVALALKTPLPLLLAALIGTGWLIQRAYREKNWLRIAPVLALAAMLAFASAFSDINIGVRHVLILYPLMAIVAAAASVALWQRTKLALIVLVSWQLWNVAAAHPDHLAHFNELAGKHPEKYLIDSDLDWGQDLKRLKAELQRRGIGQFHFIYRGTADLEREGLDATLLRPHQRATGWIAASLLAKATLSEDGGYDWLNAHAPVARVGKSIDLYYVQVN